MALPHTSAQNWTWKKIDASSSINHRLPFTLPGTNRKDHDADEAKTLRNLHSIVCTMQQWLKLQSLEVLNESLLPTFFCVLME